MSSRASRVWLCLRLSSALSRAQVARLERRSPSPLSRPALRVGYASELVELCAPTHDLGRPNGFPTPVDDFAASLRALLASHPAVHVLSMNYIPLNCIVTSQG